MSMKQKDRNAPEKRSILLTIEPDMSSAIDAERARLERDHGIRFTRTNVIRLLIKLGLKSSGSTTAKK